MGAECHRGLVLPEVQSFVWKEKSSEEKTHPWGSPEQDSEFPQPLLLHPVFQKVGESLVEVD